VSTRSTASVRPRQEASRQGSPARSSAARGGSSSRPAAASARPRRARVSRATAWRRRLLLLAAVAVCAGFAAAAMSPFVDKAVQEINLPLRHEDVIRQQAADKGVDASLIAAVIYTESHFRDQTSRAGAKGLMQLMPSTAAYIARLSGGTAFKQGDLATPQINIAYGSYYLHYLLKKYRGSEVLALAAYNGGEGKVDEWLASAAADGDTFDVARHIPYPETRAYVTKVLQAQKDYREQYPDELGL
jgi:soluble lytic murein transglycosylase